MIVKRIFLLFFLLSASFTIAQEITVIDKETTLPIPRVLVVNQDNSSRATTNEKGVVDISSFALRDVLTFKHISYSDYKVLKRLIRGKKLSRYKIKQSN